VLQPPENKALRIDCHPVREGTCQLCLSQEVVPLRRAVVHGHAYEVCAGCVAFLESRKDDEMEAEDS
jgi:hypothetical protein